MFNNRSLFYIFLICFATAVVLLLVSVLVIYPSFTRMSIENAEDQSIRTARHLSSMYLSNVTELERESLPDTFTTAIQEMAVRDYELEKVKVFSVPGETIYSTNPEDIGKINTHSYFFDIVAKGETLSKAVKQGGVTHEGREVTRDVVETYVPIMHDGSFVGAFEIYYDITRRNDELSTVVFRSALIPSVLMLVFLVMIVIVLRRLDGSMTRQKRAEESLERRAQELEQLVRSNRELTQFAYVASHDLQEPLRMVTSYVKLLERRYKDQLDSDADEFIAFAVDGATRMKGLIDDLLAYSQVVSRRRTFEPSGCSAALDTALTNLKVSVEQSGTVVTRDRLPTVLGDASQLTQVFQNLIGNAIKFRNEQPPHVHVSCQQEEGEWVFSVRDNGIGIEPQHAERIFDVFQRLHSRQEFPGNGIGLAICKRIVEGHGGRIWTDSEPGRGSAFCFRIPVMEGHGNG